MKALWLELGDSAITAIPIHFMPWSDKSATARWIKPKRARLLIGRHVIRFLDRDAIADTPARDQGICLHRRASQPLRLLLSAPSPPSDLFIHGDLDRVALLKEVMVPVEKPKTYKDAVIEHAVLPGAKHFFEERLKPLISEVGTFLDKRLGEPARIAIPARCGPP